MNNYLDEAKKITGSDYATAKRLRVTPACVYNMRKGQISNENARKLADLIGVSPLEVIAAAEIAKHPERARDWSKWAKLASILLVVFLSFPFTIQDVRACSGIEQVMDYAKRLIARIIHAVRRLYPCSTRYNWPQSAAPYPAS